MNLQISSKGKYAAKTFYKGKGKYSTSPICGVEFLNIKSIKDEKLKFTNHFQRLNSDRNKNIKDILLNCLADASYFEHNFSGTELEQRTISDVAKLKRLNNILNLNAEKPTNNQILFKYAPNSNLMNSIGYERGLQFIFSIENDIAKIYLIDLYHLAIPSKTNLRGERYNLFDEYNHRSKYSKSIDEVVFSKKEIQFSK